PARRQDAVTAPPTRVRPVAPTCSLGASSPRRPIPTTAAPCSPGGSLHHYLLITNKSLLCVGAYGTIWTGPPLTANRRGGKERSKWHTPTFTIRSASARCSARTWKP